MDRQIYLNRISLGVKSYLKPEENVEKVVSVQTVGQYWLLLLIGVMVAVFCVGNYALHLNKFVVILSLAIVFVLLLAVNGRTEYRYVVVTNQRTFLVGGGYFGTDPGAQLLRQTSRDKNVDIPSGRWKRFDTLGERLYVRYSILAPTSTEIATET